ncbi:MAG: hypothetical protein ACXAC6_05205 [Candidatus Hodarchaeales archaeon]|jgi:hypothetical protein
MITIELVIDGLVLTHSAAVEDIQPHLNTTDELRNVMNQKIPCRRGK